MAEKVEVVIKIPKYYLTHPQDYTCLAECVRRGVILPQGHGRIADIDKVLEEMRATRTYDIPFALERVKPIIEADKESKS